REERRGGAVGRWRRREADRVAGEGDRAAVLAGDGDRRVEAELLGEGEGGAGVVALSRRGAALQQRGGPLGGGAVGEPTLQLGGQRLAVLDPRGVGGEARVGGEPGRAELLAELPELAVVADREDKLPLAGRVDLIRGDARMAI